jgi:nicotinamide-nucleotide amidase
LIDTFLTLHQLIVTHFPGLLCFGAESCTGGQVAGRICSYAGASSWFWGATVVYANQAKTALLGVPQATLEQYGAVSPQTVLAMLQGLTRIQPDCLRYAISGIAGPGGGSPDKPVGLVYIGVAFQSFEQLIPYQWQGTRQQIQAQAVEACGTMLLSALQFHLTESKN